MTIIDNIWEFSYAQSVVLTDASEVISEDILDLGGDQQDGFFATVATTRMGEQAKAPVLLLTIATTLVGGAATLLCEFVSSTDATLTDDDTIHMSVIFPALSAAGTQRVLPLTWDAYNRYVGVYYTAAGGDITAGAINAHVVEAGQLID